MGNLRAFKAGVATTAAVLGLCAIAPLASADQPVDGVVSEPDISVVPSMLSVKLTDQVYGSLFVKRDGRAQTASIVGVSGPASEARLRRDVKQIVVTQGSKRLVTLKAPSWSASLRSVPTQASALRGVQLNIYRTVGKPKTSVKFDVQLP